MNFSRENFKAILFEFSELSSLNLEFTHKKKFANELEFFLQTTGASGTFLIFILAFIYIYYIFIYILVGTRQ